MEPPRTRPIQGAHQRTNSAKAAEEHCLPSTAAHPDPSQLDLFDPPAVDIQASPSTRQAPIEPGSMSDGELLRAFSRGSLGSVGILAQEISR